MNNNQILDFFKLVEEVCKAINKNFDKWNYALSVDDKMLQVSCDLDTDWPFTINIPLGYFNFTKEEIIEKMHDDIRLARQQNLEREARERAEREAKLAQYEREQYEALKKKYGNS